jgi:hypothetical protein
VPVVPVFLHGTGRALPGRSLLLVPFNCDVFVGQPLLWSGDRDQFMTSLESALHTLFAEHHLSKEKARSDNAFDGIGIGYSAFERAAISGSVLCRNEYSNPALGSIWAT